MSGTAYPGSASIQEFELLADSDGLYVPEGQGVCAVEPDWAT